MPPHSEGVARFLPSHKRISVLEDDDSKGTFILLMNIAGIAGGMPALSALTCDWKMIAAALCCRSRDPGCWMRRYVLGSASHETLAAVYLELGSQRSLHGVSRRMARLRIIDRPNFFDAIQAFRHFYHLDLRLLQGRSRRSRTAVDDEEWSQLQTAAPPRIRLSRHVPWPGPLVHLVNPSPHRRRTRARKHMHRGASCVHCAAVGCASCRLASPSAWSSGFLRSSSALPPCCCTSRCPPSPRPHARCARRCHSCTGTGAHRCHICTGTEPAAATSAARLERYLQIMNWAAAIVSIGDMIAGVIGFYLGTWYPSVYVSVPVSSPLSLGHF